MRSTSAIHAAADIRPAALATVALILVVLSGAAVRIGAQPAILSADPSLAVRSNLGGTVNGARSEILPVLSADGKTMYFDRKFDARNVGGSNDEDDIYETRMQGDGTWSQAVNVGPPLNTPGSDVLFWISPDGNTALVHNGGVLAGRTIGLSIARRGPGGAWMQPVSVTIQGIASLDDHVGYSATISPDRRRMIISLQRDTGAVDNPDLFICTAIGDDLLTWSRPVSMGDTVNSVLYEWAPFVASDNLTLYYASGGLVGYGASDIYMTRRLDDTWTRWSEPVNLGPTINTVGYEASLVVAPDRKTAYMSTNGSGIETGYGKADLYRCVLPDSVRPYQMATIIGTLKGPSGALQGLVRLLDAATGREVASAASTAAGLFEFTVNAGGRYRVTGWAEGHRERAVEVDARALRKGRAKVGLTLVSAAAPVSPKRPPSVVRRTDEPAPVATENALELSGFASGSAELPAEVRRALGAFVTDVKTLHAGLVLGIEVVGLSQAGAAEPAADRAEAVRAWLLANGLQDMAIVASTRTNEGAPRGTAGGQVVLKLIKTR